MTLLKRDTDAEEDSPPSPSSYFFPLLLAILACAAYIFLRRKRKAEALGIPLTMPGSAPPAIRLSTDGPPNHSFITNNLSTDSLPSHALSDLPDLSNTSHPALSGPPFSDMFLGQLSEPSLPSSSRSPAGGSNGGFGGIRRSMRGQGRKDFGPVEDSGSESERSSTDGDRGVRFEIGGDDEYDRDAGPL